MAKVEVPHFDFPMRMSTTGHPLEVEQDSNEDIINCIEAAVRTVKGQRLEIPDFGIADPTFGSQPLRLDSLMSSILAHESRASILFDTHPDILNYMIARVTLRVSTREVENG